MCLSGPLCRIRLVPLAVESNTPARLPPYRLTVCGLDELVGHTRSGVSHILSILDPDTPMPRVLSRFEALRAHWVQHFHDVSRPVGDARMPERADVEELLSFGAELRGMEGAAHLLVHCHAGVSRSTAAAAILLAQHAPGREREAVAEVARIRPVANPNVRMIELADTLLQREGRLLAALRELRTRRQDEMIAGRRRFAGLF